MTISHVHGNNYYVVSVDLANVFGECSRVIRVNLGSRFGSDKWLELFKESLK